MSEYFTHEGPSMNENDTDKYESMRQLFLDFIDSASDEVDEGAWKNKLTMLDELLAEIKRLREGIEHALHIRLRHGQEEGWKELKELIE